MGRITRGLTILVAIVAVSFAIHYALFGSLPLGKPQLLDNEPAEEEPTEAWQ
ncbi:hypothetical protein [Haladaptatus sp. NG-SE-30]